MRRNVLGILLATSLPVLALGGIHCGSSDEASGTGTPPGADGSVSGDGDTSKDAAPDATEENATGDDGAAGDAGDGGAVETGADGAATDGSEADAEAPDGASTDGGQDASSADGTSDSAMDDGNSGDGGGDSAAGDSGGQTDGGDAGSVPAAQVCENHQWQQAVPAAGNAMMAYGSKAYLFAQDGSTWAIIENQSALSQAIPFPSGVTEMRSVTTEMAPSGRPFVTFSSGNQRYGAFFDGQSFVGTTLLGQATSAHADALERIYAVTSNGLTEFDHGNSPIVRGALPYSQPGWTVGANGTVYVMYTESRPSTIHPGDTAIDLKLTHLDHGSLTWTGHDVITSNEGWGFSNVGFVAARDGSLHVAYALSYEAYYYHSHDAVAWQQETFKDIVSKATLVDPAVPIYNDDPVEVKGNIRLVAAQDYDHVSITLIYAGGSMSVPSFYFLRRCAPFSGLNNTWPAERLAFSGMAFDNGAVAVNEVGLASILTPNGVRKDVVVP